MNITKRFLNRFMCAAVGSAALCLFIASTTGCVEGRSSTHELEHAVPAHWPSSLTDAAEKIEARLKTIHGEDAEAIQSRSELLEIISWLPEVAADTTLREPDWNSIYAACTDIERHIKATDNFQEREEELRKLCTRLRALESQETGSLE